MPEHGYYDSSFSDDWFYLFDLMGHISEMQNYFATQSFPGGQFLEHLNVVKVIGSRGLEQIFSKITGKNISLVLFLPNKLCT